MPEEPRRSFRPKARGPARRLGQSWEKCCRPARRFSTTGRLAKRHRCTGQGPPKCDARPCWANCSCSSQVFSNPAGAREAPRSARARRLSLLSTASRAPLGGARSRKSDSKRPQVHFSEVQPGSSAGSAPDLRPRGAKPRRAKPLRDRGGGPAQNHVPWRLRQAGSARKERLTRLWPIGATGL